MNRLAGVLLLLAIGLPAAALAQQRHDLVFQLGYLHVQTPDSSTPLHTDLRSSLVGTVLGIQSPFDSPGTSASVSNGNTLALTVAWFITDDLSIKLDGGIPIRFSIRGDGVVAPTGLSGRLFNVNLGDPASNPIATAKQWTPAIILQYKFLDARDRLRPFAGLGFGYTWFTEVAINRQFQDQLNQNFGRVLATAARKPGPTSVHTDATQSFDPVINLGLSYRLTEHLGLSLSQSYSPISTVANIDINAADGTQLSHSVTRIKTSTLATGLLLDYRY